MRRHVSFAALTLVGVVATGGCGSPGDNPVPPQQPPASAQKLPPPPSAQQNSRYLADDLPLLPDGVHMAVRPLPIVRAAYEFAARRPDVMKYVPCFCGCERGGHKDNHDCFVASRGPNGKVTAWDTHGIGCEICIDVAHQTQQMHNSGASITAIRDAIEKRYAGAHGHTPTQMPKHGGTIHD